MLGDKWKLKVGVEFQRCIPVFTSSIHRLCLGAAGLQETPRGSSSRAAVTSTGCDELRVCMVMLGCSFSIRCLSMRHSEPTLHQENRGSNGCVLIMLSIRFRDWDQMMARWHCLLKGQTNAGWGERGGGGGAFLPLSPSWSYSLPLVAS